MRQVVSYNLFQKVKNNGKLSNHHSKMVVVTRMIRAGSLAKYERKVIKWINGKKIGFLDKWLLIIMGGGCFVELVTSIEV